MTDFGQSNLGQSIFGHRVLPANFGQSIFGQIWCLVFWPFWANDIFGQSILGQSVFGQLVLCVCVVCVFVFVGVIQIFVGEIQIFVGVVSLCRTPLRWTAQNDALFYPLSPQIFFLSSLSWGSFR